jgi:argininosuccinate lyase
MKLWSKGYAVAPLIEQYESARNAQLDAELAPYDIWGSLAHARMLTSIGLLTKDEWLSIHKALVELLHEAEAGTLLPNMAEEDIHTLIETQLTERLGEVGKKIHTGRSRNDQVLVDIRLYAREALVTIAQNICKAAESLLELARRYEWTPMPGYTHMQRAMLSSVGLWASSHAASLLDSMVSLAAAYDINDRCPLGSGAAFGAPLPLDRDLTASLLGFASPHDNVLTAANARGKGESAVVQSLAMIMLDLSKFAQDVLLYTTSEYGFCRVPPELCSGSSMMPQKYNLGALEIMRGRTQTIISMQTQMAGLPSGYNMDYQETKAPLIESVHICNESLSVAAIYAEHLSFDEERVRAACTSELFATDRAYDLVIQGVPFRDAYRQVAKAPAAGDGGDLDQRLRARTLRGGTGNLGLDALAERIYQEQLVWEARHEHVQSAIESLIALAD